MRSHSFCKSSIGQKQILAFSGLALCGFLITHLLGNFLLFCGPEVFNLYSYTLISNPLIGLAEFILVSLFLVHIVLAIKLNWENKKARPVAYAKKVHTGRGANFASSTMVYTGIITLVFLVLHIWKIKYGADYPTTQDGTEMRDMYRTVVEYFSSIGNVIWYVFAHFVLAIHTCHGFHSAFQSIGFNHPKYTPKLKCLSKLYAIGIGGGFAAIAIFCYLKGGA